jgi:hypothetical protein
VKIQHQQQCIEPFMTNRTVFFVSDDHGRTKPRQASKRKGQQGRNRNGRHRMGMEMPKSMFFQAGIDQLTASVIRGT